MPTAANLLWNQKMFCDHQNTTASVSISVTEQVCVTGVQMMSNEFYVQGLHKESEGAVNVSKCHVRRILISRLNLDQYSCLYYRWVMWNLQGWVGGLFVSHVERWRTSIRTDGHLCPPSLSVPNKPLLPLFLAPIPQNTHKLGHATGLQTEHIRTHVRPSGQALK